LSFRMPVVVFKEANSLASNGVRRMAFCMQRVQSQRNGYMSERQQTDYIMIHCAATKPSMDITAKDIDKWHRQKGWRKIGYHWVVCRDGTVEEGREISEVGAHCRGYNDKSIGICMVGGIDEEGNPESNFTSEQWDALAKLVWQMKLPYPDAEVVGHNEFSSKACPSFNVREWWNATEVIS